MRSAQDLVGEVWGEECQMYDPGRLVTAHKLVFGLVTIGLPSSTLGAGLSRRPPPALRLVSD
jgi:hypothetical protein